jgi:hypothetical protein
MKISKGPAKCSGALTVAGRIVVLVFLVTAMGWLRSFADNQPLGELRTAEQIRPTCIIQCGYGVS